MSAIQDLLLATTFGKPQQHGALTMVPLIVAQSLPEFGFLVLDDAIETGRFSITEVSDTGSVPQLRASNELATPVFLLDGEEVVGAKQNRVLNLSLIIGANSQAEIPVSCVEAGRWQRKSDAFAAAPRAHFAEGRAARLRSVSKSLKDERGAVSDQAEVWDLIAQKSNRMECDSPTSAMADLYERSSPRLSGYLTAFEPLPSQLGAVYAIGSRVVGAELFSSPTAWAKLSAKVTGSYAMDALESEELTPGKAPAAQVSAHAKSFLIAMLNAATQRYAAAGLGETVRFESDKVAGAGLELAGQCVHLAAYAAAPARSAVV